MYEFLKNYWVEILFVFLFLVFVLWDRRINDEDGDLSRGNVIPSQGSALKTKSDAQNLCELTGGKWNDGFFGIGSGCSSYSPY